MKDPDKGYRRINDDLYRKYDIRVNDKRVLRICRVRGIRSTIKYANRGCTRQAVDPQFIAENVLNRKFTADRPNEKWLTDVTEFKWYDENRDKHKVYLSGVPVHQQGVPYQTGESRYDAEYVQGRQMHRQRSDGRVLGDTQT